MAEMLINQWGGISDDPFLTRENECLDMDGIDIRTTPRRITCDSTFSGVYATNTLSAGGENLNHMTETLDGVVQSYQATCYINSTPITGLVAGADKQISVGSNTNDYNSTTNPDGLRHFFFTYNGTTNPIKVVGYSGGVRTVLTSINTSGGAPATAVITPGLNTSTVCYLWEGAVLFARGNNIYELNPNTSLLSAGSAVVGRLGAKISLPYGAVVKFINYSNGIINIVYTVENNTYVQGCSYNGTTYTMLPYIDKTIGEKCISAVANGNTIYWISTSGIFQHSGQSQIVKAYTFSSSAIVAYNKGVLRIGDGTNFFEYGVQKPGYGRPLTRFGIGAGLSIKGITETYIITLSGTQYRIDTKGGGYKASSTYLFSPYTGGRFGIEKKGLGVAVGYFLPRGTYTDPSIQASIILSIQTKDMELTETYVNIATITDKNLTKIEIAAKDIAKILGLSSYSEQFPLFKIKITLNAGDAFAGFGNTIFRKTPEVYDVYLTHDEIKQSI